jgi:proline iminopeptidase
MTQRFLDVNGTTVFVDDRGSKDAPALVYVHGGPGMGCHDFMAVQGDLLSSRLRVVGVDQRGVLRSGPVGDGTLSTRTVVDDLEAVRERLGIESWTVLGHSAGSPTALDYALWHADSLHGVVFDCPTFDADSTDRYRLPVVADLLDRYGEPEAAGRCRALAGRPERLTAADGARTAMRTLGGHYQELFFHSVPARHDFEAGMAQAGFGDETWARGASHEVLYEDLYTDRVPLLDGLTVPSLLVRGAHDLATPPDMVRRYQAGAVGGTVHVFGSSAHFPYREEPEAYAELVVAFTERVST